MVSVAKRVPITHDEWRSAWNRELAARLARADAGRAEWISLDEARERLRAATQSSRRCR